MPRFEETFRNCICTRMRNQQRYWPSPQQLLTHGPSTYVIHMPEPSDENFTATVDCSIGPDAAIC